MDTSGTSQSVSAPLGLGSANEAAFFSKLFARARLDATPETDIDDQRLIDKLWPAIRVQLADRLQRGEGSGERSWPRFVRMRPVLGRRSTVSLVAGSALVFTVGVGVLVALQDESRIDLDSEIRFRGAVDEVVILSASPQQKARQIEDVLIAHGARTTTEDAGSAKRIQFCRSGDPATLDSALSEIGVHRTLNRCGVILVHPHAEGIPRED